MNGKNAPIITLILGPGSHLIQLTEAIKSYGVCFETFKYYPKFTHVVYDSNGKITHETNSFLASWIVRLLWAVIIRIKPLKNRNYHFFLNYIIFDWWISKNYASSSKLLWAWTQVSLKTMQAFKKKNLPIILENPVPFMHPDEWDAILEKEYNKYASGIYCYYTMNSFLKKVMLKEYELADKVILLSNYSKDIFTTHFKNKEKIELVKLYVKNHVDTKHKYIQKDTINLLFVGRIDILKGIPRLLNVVDELIVDYPNLILTLVGDLKDDASSLFQVERPYIKLIGSKTQIELADYYKQADVFILPSVQESFGMVLLEALSYNLKVVASRNTGAPDIAGHCDKIYLFNPFDEKEMKEKILLTIQNHNIQYDCDLSLYTKKKYESEIHRIIDLYRHG